MFVCSTAASCGARWWNVFVTGVTVMTTIDEVVGPQISRNHRQFVQLGIA